VFTEKEDPVKTAYRLVRSMASRDTAFVTIIYGEDITEEQAQKLSDMLESRMGGDVEITLINGGQPVYYFIVSVE
jgi:dihydroxyacetone kinase-like predicted kinase